jgi:uridine phosphorylase
MRVARRRGDGGPGAPAVWRRGEQRVRRFHAARELEHGYLAFCLARAADEDKSVQAYLKGRKSVQRARSGVTRDLAVDIHRHRNLAVAQDLHRHPWLNIQGHQQGGAGRLLTDNAWEDGLHPLLDGARRPAGGTHALRRRAPGRRAARADHRHGLPCLRRLQWRRGVRSDLTLGHLIIVNSALRDEGTSHHYLPAGRHVDADLVAVGVVTRLLRERGVAFQTGRVWTTDAPYRETPAKIESRRAEGCIAVEMEAAALAAVAHFRGVPLGHLLYCADDLSSAAWDHRSWQTQADVRDNLLSLAASAALQLRAASELKRHPTSDRLATQLIRRLASAAAAQSVVVVYSHPCGPRLLNVCSLTGRNSRGCVRATETMSPSPFGSA